MENLIIKNLLEQVQRLTDENNMLKEKLSLKELPVQNITEETSLSIANETQRSSPKSITEETPENIYISIEHMITEKYTDALNLDEFEIVLKSRVTEFDMLDCLDKNVKDVIINILTRELSNKQLRPIHKNKYYVVKINNEWVKKEYFDFHIILKRLINIVINTMILKLFGLKKMPGYVDGGPRVHSYKHYKFDYDEFKIKLLGDLNHQVISKAIGNRLHINL